MFKKLIVLCSLLLAFNAFASRHVLHLYVDGSKNTAGRIEFLLNDTVHKTIIYADDMALRYEIPISDLNLMYDAKIEILSYLYTDEKGVTYNKSFSDLILCTLISHPKDSDITPTNTTIYININGCYKVEVLMGHY
jgi:hypothetical protein